MNIFRGPFTIPSTTQAYIQPLLELDIAFCIMVFDDILSLTFGECIFSEMIALGVEVWLLF